MLQQQGANQEGNSNQLLVPQVENAIEQMKYEIAHELGITLGADTSSRDNGRVGGEMVKRMIKIAQQQMESDVKNKLH